MAEKYEWMVVARMKGQRRYTVVSEALTWDEAVDTAGTLVTGDLLRDAFGMKVFYVHETTQAVLEDDGRWVPIKGQDQDHDPKNLDCRWGACQHTRA